ncbi:MAG TPA: ABC transporter permease, partial [Armatimonadota bacterium]|nr:ABC transporter permease [Armatimonadota bacterium]
MDTSQPATSKSLSGASVQRRRGAGFRALTALAINVGAAFGSLRANWFRSFLTVLGVVIGVASVIVLVAFGTGAQKEITSQIDTLGTNVAIVVPGKMRGQTNFNPMGGLGISNLGLREVEALRGLPGIRGVAPVLFLGGGVYYGQKPAPICMPIATTPEFKEIRRLTI